MNTFNMMTKANYRHRQQREAANKRRYARRRRAAFRQSALTVATDLALIAACFFVLLACVAWCL